MSNDITSILQPVALQNRTPGQSRGGSQPTVVASPAASPGDRVSLTDSARLLQIAESKPGQTPVPQSDSSDIGMTYTRTDDGFRGKGLMTSAGGQQYTREVSVSFDLQSQSMSRQVNLTGQNGEVSRSTELTRTDKGFEAVMHRVGVQGNVSVRETQVFIEPDSTASEGGNSSSVESNAQSPSPALANMMESFYTTSDMEGFDTNSDLNADGVINFQDLGALKAIEEGVKAEP